ncbi:MAG: VWA domain-containing protein [Gammaproteobacteria bacterium]|nr:VWA domain-containing protein [Gammaproteobacteria bacterium]
MNATTPQAASSTEINADERQAIQFVDIERKLHLYLRALWQDEDNLTPYLLDTQKLRQPIPYFDIQGIYIPHAIVDSKNGISGLNRYRTTLAHMAAHRRWSETMKGGDHYSRLQLNTADLFEDARVEYLAIKQYPGLRTLFLAQHPVPVEDACDPETQSCVHHRTSMMSYALLNPEHGYKSKDIIEYSQRFHAIMQASESSTKEITTLALSFVLRTKRQSDQLPDVYLKDTKVGYRDDNRHLWEFLEDGGEEAINDEDDATDEAAVLNIQPIKYYHEWNYNSQSYYPDWCSIYESLHPSGYGSEIDRLLRKHTLLCKRLKQMLDMLKPQDHQRVRYQEDGCELDLDIALRSLIDLKCGIAPDPRINVDHKHNSRNISVMLLLDLSASLDDVQKGCKQSILKLSQEAVSILAWAIEKLGDPFAIAGFCSNTRNEVQYKHIKEFDEHWGYDIKARLAALEARYSTRMGAAMRHAGHYLSQQQTDKKLLLVLTDGEPADVDVDKDDPQLLIQDAHKAVQE